MIRLRDGLLLVLLIQEERREGSVSVVRTVIGPAFNAAEMIANRSAGQSTRSMLSDSRPPAEFTCADQPHTCARCSIRLFQTATTRSDPGLAQTVRRFTFMAFTRHDATPPVPMGSYRYGRS